MDDLDDDKHEDTPAAPVRAGRFCIGLREPSRPDSSLAAIYSPLAKLPDYERNPVIVIPGVLGSRLVDNEVLRELLPNVATREERQCIAMDHQQKCLLKAKQLHQSLDIPASPPPGMTLHLYAGDAIETPAVMSVDTNNGDVRVAAYLPGDDTTTRHSALMSERSALLNSVRPTTPIHWSSVMLLHTSHRKLTADPVFTDNLLALLLESPQR